MRALLLAALLALPAPRVSVNGVAQLPNRPTLNLVGQIACSDNASAASKDCTISSGGPATQQAVALSMVPTEVAVDAPWVTATSVIVCGVEGATPALVSVVRKAPGIGFSVLIQAPIATVDLITLDCLGGSQ